MAAHSRRTRTRQKKSKTPLDTFREKRLPGRPARMSSSEVQNRGNNYRQMLGRMWDRVGTPLVAAGTVGDVRAAFQREGPHEHQEFGTLAPMILEVLREKRFPQRPKAQIRFLAESLAGRESMSARRARDICERGRREERNRKEIVLYALYVECSCGYKGRSENLACAKCGAVIPLDRDLGLSQLF
jgi:hypothetical protein